MYKKNLIKSLIIIFIIAFIGFQVYFDLAVRKTNGTLFGRLQLHEQFFLKEFPDQTKAFNSPNETSGPQNQK